MPSSYPPQARRSVFVFWGDHFDEIVTAIFIGTLRRRGLRVYSVGLDGPTAIGQYGMMITADRIFGQTLSMVAQVGCLIAPCDTDSFLRAENDLRFMRFIAKVMSHQACLVLSDATIISHSTLMQMEVAPEQILFYGDHYDLQQFGDSLANRLLANSEGV